MQAWRLCKRRVQSLRPAGANDRFASRCDESLRQFEPDAGRTSGDQDDIAGQAHRSGSTFSRRKADGLGEQDRLRGAQAKLLCQMRFVAIVEPGRHALARLGGNLKIPGLMTHTLQAGQREVVLAVFDQVDGVVHDGRELRRGRRGPALPIELLCWTLPTPHLPTEITSSPPWPAAELWPRGGVPDGGDSASRGRQAGPAASRRPAALRPPSLKLRRGTRPARPGAPILGTIRTLRKRKISTSLVS